LKNEVETRVKSYLDSVGGVDEVKVTDKKVAGLLGVESVSVAAPKPQPPRSPQKPATVTPKKAKAASSLNLNEIISSVNIKTLYEWRDALSRAETLVLILVLAELLSLVLSQIQYGSTPVLHVLNLNVVVVLYQNL
jgi:hypothetical protein